MPIVLNSWMLKLALTNLRALLVGPLLAVCLVACLVWLVLCLLLLPIVMFVSSWQRKAVA
jgi:hypothetical protein